MKVLFAVSNDNVSSSIIKKYQEKYKEIITSKNVYYFNAIIKELQKDKTYDAVVIGEDLEPISNNNYDTIDKFIFDKLDSISDEAYKISGEDIPIILICSDRRTKSDSLLIKLFGIGIYNALLGNDRNIDMVCNLINKPRSKKEAKAYYKIDSEDVNYKPEAEVEVSETEIKNILNHYKKIGSNEKKCIESFDSIASQYTETQLRIIIKFLPNSVKQILERGSNKYQKLVNGGTVLTNGAYAPYSPSQKTVNKSSTDFLTKDIEKPNLTKPVIIPSTMNIASSVNRNNVMPQKVENTGIATVKPQQINNNTLQNANGMPQVNNANMQRINTIPQVNNEISQNIVNTPKLENDLETAEKREVIQNNQVETPQVKRRGRPRKINVEPEKVETNSTLNSLVEQNNNLEELKEEIKPVKRGRGRPKKVNVVAEDLEQNNTNNVEQNNIDKETTNEDNSFNLFELGNEGELVNQLENQDTSHINNESVNLFDMANNVDYSNPAITPYELNAEYFNDNQAEQNTKQEIQNNQEINSNDFYNPYGQTNYNPYNDANFANQNFDLGNQNVQQETVSNNIGNDVGDNQFNGNQMFENYSAKNEISKTIEDTNVVPSNFIAQNKIVAFVGTSKNGTSFIVNNLAELLSQKGIKTAILDLTKNKNSYYMFTDNDQRLMQIATNSIKNLEKGIVQGVEVNKNLTVFTALPDEFDETENFETILQTLDNNYQAILLDCDFNTNINYFVKATEIYLVQSMDALTIQPLTKFLSELKLKNALEESKLRIIINKEMKLKILNDKMIIGGMAKYNEPSMTLQRDLFNPNTIKYVTIPFEMQTYARYLESIALCQISLSGYSSTLIDSLERLANMVYPLVSGGNYTNYSPNYGVEKKGFFKSKNKKQPPTQFSSGVNNTLNKMRTNY